jgi:hypothetical protein
MVGCALEDYGDPAKVEHLLGGNKYYAEMVFSVGRVGAGKAGGE